VTVRIAMWSGPRNISTAMMRAFENRPDTEVIDEPFYAAFLARSGADHPLRAEVLAAHEADPEAVARAIAGEAPGGAAIFYQKHMTHHMLPGFPRGWMDRCRHAFLIRAPERVLASYAKRRAEVTLADIGFPQQGELFDEVASRLGAAPPVIDADDVLADPARALGALCQALEIPFDPAMLSWPAGPRASDGAWAPAWYDAVERSTGFGPPSPRPVLTEPRLAALADEARPIYERLAAYRI
jgi:hypothetical protein